MHPCLRPGVFIHLCCHTATARRRVSEYRRKPRLTVAPVLCLLDDQNSVQARCVHSSFNKHHKNRHRSSHTQSTALTSRSLALSLWGKVPGASASSSFNPLSKRLPRNRSSGPLLTLRSSTFVSRRGLRKGPYLSMRCAPVTYGTWDYEHRAR